MLPVFNFIWLTVVAILGLMLVDMMLKAERPLFKAMAVRVNVFLLCCLGVQAWSVWMGQQNPEGYVLREDTVVDGFLEQSYIFGGKRILNLTSMPYSPSPSNGKA